MLISEMKQHHIAATTLLNTYITNTTNIILDDAERNGWERQVGNLNFLTNLCKKAVSTKEVEKFFSTGILPLLLDVNELEGVTALSIDGRYVIELQPNWL